MTEVRTEHEPLRRPLRRPLRTGLAVAAVACALAAILMPTGWYDTLPRSPELPPKPFDGLLLFRATLMLEALILAVISVTGWHPAGSGSASRAALYEEAGDISPVGASALLAAITAVALVLRIYKLDADLWLDEIAIVGTYAARPLAEVFAAYLSPGNHLLNSLLLKISVAGFGESEWSVRIPAVAFGIATIPAMYYAARMAMSRVGSLLAALLLAVSYHHIFFSQNAKGYSGHLLFTLLSSALLASALKRGGLWTWVSYAVSMTLGFAALMTTAFTFGAHVAVAAAYVFVRWRRGSLAPGEIARPLIGFAATALLAFQVYAIALPDVLAIYPTVFAVQGSGYIILSREFLNEIMRGVSSGFSLFGLAALPVIALGIAGFVVLFRRNWILAASLALTVALTIAFLLLRGQSVAPRMLLTSLPLAILSAVATFDAASRLLARRWNRGQRGARAMLLGVSAVVCVASVLALPSYYSAPKQPYRATLRRLETQPRAGERVILIFPAAGGFRYYLKREHVDTTRYRFVTTSADYDSVYAPGARGEDKLVTTLFRVLRSTEPTLADRVERDWVPSSVLRGTLGGGDMTIWRPRAAGP